MYMPVCDGIRSMQSAQAEVIRCSSDSPDATVAKSATKKTSFWVSLISILNDLSLMIEPVYCRYRGPNRDAGPFPRQSLYVAAILG